jgi:hypothetical protein
MSKKNKSNIKYGAYIYNELKTKQKANNTIINQNKTNLSFQTLLGITYESYTDLKTYHTITLGGLPITNSFYNRLNILYNKILQKEINTSLQDYEDSLDSNIDDVDDYLNICQIQNQEIQEEENSKNYTTEDFIDFYIDII